MWSELIIFSVITLTISDCAAVNKRPNIILFVADDLGWNDVGFHGSSEIPTPNIDALAHNGVVLDRFYAQSSCTPSRAALLTGQYPIRIGYQSYPIFTGENRVLPANLTTLPKELKKLGYKNHLVGKWHLGAASAASTPLEQGFDSHFGYWYGYIGYFNHISSKEKFDGIDLHDDFVPLVNQTGNYFTDLLTERSLQLIDKHNNSEPLFLSVNHLAPHTGVFINGIGYLEVADVNETNAKYDYIKEPTRRLLADIVEKMDTSIGLVIDRLRTKGLLENSIIVFISDNGGPTEGYMENSSSNFPFKGIKMTSYEGGIKVPAVIYSPKIKKKGRVFKNLFHITDLVNTLYSAAGGCSQIFESADGIDQWNNIRLNQNLNLREDMLVDLSDKFETSAFIGYNGKYKLLNGTNDKYANYTGVAGSDIPHYLPRIENSLTNLAIAKIERRPPLNVSQLMKRRKLTVTNNCRPKHKTKPCIGICLYDLENDPCESNDISEQHPEIVETLWMRILEYKALAVLQPNNLIDERADPKYCRGTWWNYLDGPEGCYYNNLV